MGSLGLEIRAGPTRSGASPIPFLSRLPGAAGSGRVTRRQVQLDERVTKLRLTPRELAAIPLERRSTRAGSPQLLSPDDECSDPLAQLLDSGRQPNRCDSLAGDQAHHS
jgi:hypothetical protein